jgi:hypothetical protein
VAVKVLPTDLTDPAEIRRLATECQFLGRLGQHRHVADDTRRSIVFFDEWTTAAPAVQAPALRPLTHGQVGSQLLPDRVSFGAAATPDTHRRRPNRPLRRETAPQPHLGPTRRMRPAVTTPARKSGTAPGSVDSLTELGAVPFALGLS